MGGRAVMVSTQVWRREGSLTSVLWQYCDGGQPFPVSGLPLSILKLDTHSWCPGHSGPHHQEIGEIQDNMSMASVHSHV